jgi:hypothetical protein
LFLSEVCWKSGVPTEGEREGEGRPFRGRKGQVFPAREPRKGHFGSIERGDKGFFQGEFLSAAKSDFFETLREKLEAEGEMSNFKIQMINT